MSCLFNKVQVPHYNYVGDSILGYKSHMGAGSITSNVKSDKKAGRCKSTEMKILRPDMKKFGAMLGDEVEVGCGSVLNPGTVIGSHSNIYPLSSCQRIRTGQTASIKSKGEVVEEGRQSKKRCKCRETCGIHRRKGKQSDEEDRIHRRGDHGKIHGAQPHESRV